MMLPVSVNCQKRVMLGLLIDAGETESTALTVKPSPAAAAVMFANETGV